MAAAAAVLLAASAVDAHPWHRHRGDEHEAAGGDPAHADAPASVSVRLVSTRKPAAPEVDVAAAFA
ncbi:MAG: hypothetical protein ACKON8_11675, partial [Planctomycetota bacterium]